MSSDRRAPPSDAYLLTEFRISLPRIGVKISASAAPAHAPAHKPAASEDHDEHESDDDIDDDDDELDHGEPDVLASEDEGRLGLYTGSLGMMTFLSSVNGR